MEGFTLTIGNIQGQQINVGPNIVATQTNNYGKDKNFLSDEILHIIGEKTFGVDDALALKNARAKTVVVHAEIEPYYSALETELLRQREDNKVLKYWHISAHGNRKDGILFGKKWTNWDTLYNLLSPFDQLEVLFLSACESIDLADKINGVFKYILATTIEIPNSDAIKITEIFWKNILNGQTPEESFESVKVNSPSFSPNMRLRS